MGAEEGRAFYWRTLGGSNGCFSSPYQYLGTDIFRGSQRGTVPPAPFSRTPASARMRGSP